MTKGMWGWALCFVLPLWAQTGFYLVYFEDKPDSLLLHPEKSLSPWALERRFRQGIPIDKADVSAPPAWIDSLRCYGTFWGYSRWLNAALMELPNSARLPRWSFVRCMEPLTWRARRGRSSLASFRLVQAPGKAASVVNALQLDQLKLPALHAMGYTGRGIRVAIFDAGFPNMNQIPAFQALFQEGRYLGGYDFVAGDSSVFEDNSHGTQVASVIVAHDPEGIGFVGGAPGVSVLLARTENALSESRLEEWNWARAAEWADSMGAHIIQSSLGYSTFDDPAENYTYADMNGRTAITTQAALTAARKGLLVVNSAGNEGASPWRYITAPADADSILAVGAIGSSGQIAPFSSRGPTSDGRIKPEVVALGWGTYVVSPSGQVQQASGTSFSAPLLTSLAACLWQAHPHASAQALRQAILAASDRFSQPDTVYGYGLPDGEKALQRLTSLAPASQTPLELRLYPNPAWATISVFLPDTTLGWYELTLTDTQGREVLSRPYRGFTQLSLPVDFLRPGLYWVHLRALSGSGNFTQAFIKL